MKVLSLLALLLLQDDPGSPSWVDSLSEAVDGARDNGKFILVFVHDPKQTRDLEWHQEDLVSLSRDTWVFYKRPFEKDEAEVRQLGVKTFPMILGLDSFGNEFARTDRLTVDAIRSLIKAVPDLVKAFRARLAADLKKAQAAATARENAKAFKLMLPLATLEKKGYKEIEEAQNWVVEQGQREIARIDTLLGTDEKQAQTKMQAILSDYKGTPIAAEVEIRLATLESGRHETNSALGRLAKILKVDSEWFKGVREKAKKQQDAILADGMKRIDSSVKLASVGEKESAREALRKLQDEFKGTDVERKAVEALKSLD